MSETPSGLVKIQENRLPRFVEDAYESLEKMQNFAQMLLDSQLVPNHFYEKKPVPGVQNKMEVDFSKGKLPAVVAVLIQGYQLDIPPLTALQHIIPVNGLLSIKGDLAKSMIFRSGKLLKGSWVENIEGTINDNNMVVTISAERSDNGMMSTKTFSVSQAKRAGLWIDEIKTKGADGWKYLASSWWKYPERMIYYRALGFLCRDIFSDILQGLYTTEEAADIPQDQTVMLEQANGAKILIPDGQFTGDRSKRVTSQAVRKIESKTFEPIPEVKQTATVHNTESPDNSAGALAPDKKNEAVLKEGDLTLDQMTDMETEDLMKIINTKADMVEALLIIPGKNTNKKVREVINAFQLGKLAQHVAPHIVEEKPHTDENNAGDGALNEDQGSETLSSVGPDDVINENITHAEEMSRNHLSEMSKNFDNQGQKETIAAGSADINKYNLTIPEFDKGQERDFKLVKDLYQAMLGIKPRLDNEKFLELIKNLPALQKYKNKEDFLKYATVAEINVLLNENYLSLK